MKQVVTTRPVVRWERQFRHLFARRFRCPKRKRRVCKNAGFTLLEVLIVLALIAMVAGTIGKTVFDGWRRGQVKTCRIQVRTVAGDVLQYMIDNDNQCPESLESLPKAGFGREAPRDPWGNALQLRCPGEEEKIEVFSGGLDEEVGTSDDIKSWQD